MIVIGTANVTTHLVSSLNNIFSNFFSSVFTNIVIILDKLAFINPSIVNDLTDIIGTDFNSGILLICNSLIYGFVLYYAISYLLSHLIFSQVEHPMQFIFKLLLCTLAINASLPLCHFIIYIVSIISDCLQLLGSSLFRVNISFVSLVSDLNPANYFIDGTFNLFSFDGLIKALVSINLVSLTISYAIRYVMVKILILLSPFAILSLINHKCSWIFKSWIKIFLSLLFLQLLISLLIILYFAINFEDNEIINQLIHLGIIFALSKANSFMKDFMGGLSSDFDLSTIGLFTIFKGGA